MDNWRRDMFFRTLFVCILASVLGSVEVIGGDTELGSVELFGGDAFGGFSDSEDLFQEAFDQFYSTDNEYTDDVPLPMAVGPDAKTCEKLDDESLTFDEAKKLLESIIDTQVYCIGSFFLIAQILSMSDTPIERCGDLDEWRLRLVDNQGIKTFIKHYDDELAAKCVQDIDTVTKISEEDLVLVTKFISYARAALVKDPRTEKTGYEHIKSGIESVILEISGSDSAYSLPTKEMLEILQKIRDACYSFVQKDLMINYLRKEGFLEEEKYAALKAARPDYSEKMFGLGVSLMNDEIFRLEGILENQKKPQELEDEEEPEAYLDASSV